MTFLVASLSAPTLTPLPPSASSGKPFCRLCGGIYQDSDKAIANIVYALDRWGIDRTAQMLERESGRFGTIRGAWYTADRKTRRRRRKRPSPVLRQTTVVGGCRAPPSRAATGRAPRLRGDRMV